MGNHAQSGTLYLSTTIRFDTYDACDRMRGAGTMMKAIGSLRPGMENSLMIDGVGFSRRDEVLDPSRDAT